MVLRETCSFSYGDVAHLVVGNHNLAHSLCFGIWTVGGVASLGDPNLEAATISKQVGCPSCLGVLSYVNAPTLPHHKLSLRWG